MAPPPWRRAPAGGGAFLQNVLYGYAGVALEEDGIVLRPILPPLGVTELTLRGLAFAGSRLRYSFNATDLSLSLAAVDRVGAAAVLRLTDAAGTTHTLPATLPLQRVLLHVAEQPAGPAPA
eukprot:SAG11_NODE_977_length_6327_cov_5.944605_2_plen_121_part_00